MLLSLIVLWICYQLSAPFWCYVLIWLYMALKIVTLGNALVNEKRRRKSSMAGGYWRHKMSE